MTKRMKGVYQRGVIHLEEPLRLLASRLVRRWVMEKKRKGISEQDIEAAWSKEIKRRLAEIDAGSVELIPWEEVRAELFPCQ